MKKHQIRPQVIRMLADTLTPVSIYLKIRDQFANSVLLESSDYKSSENVYSFIGMKPLANFTVKEGKVSMEMPNGELVEEQAKDVPQQLQDFIQSFELIEHPTSLHTNGFFGYSSYDAVQYFENLQLKSLQKENAQIPEICYTLYKYVITIHHFKNELFITENLLEGEESQIEKLQTILDSKNFASYHFKADRNESSNITDEQFKEMVKKGREHCHKGNVFQIVLSRQFSQSFKGDDFNLYRALRSVNPSPYLYYFDFGNFRIFGSSPEAQIKVENQKAYIHPIAGTFRRTGDDRTDFHLARQLSQDPKENAEHVMLVDLARNDLSRNSKKVVVEKYKEIEYYSHVIHLVSRVSGELEADANPIRIMADSFPAGTLSGAPKYKAMQLIDGLENQRRGYYGGCLGYIGFDGTINQAIMIRSFLSKNNRLFYQAGAGVVADSKEESELQEVNNKLAALKTAIKLAEEI